MIISKTPYRISFFGGGTDYPSWLCNNDGAVLSTTIDKYCYINCRYLPPFFPTHKYRILYSQTEVCQYIDEIKHPIVRESLNMLDITKGVEIHHDGDLPARSGIGSSSSFTVGLLNALHGLKGKIISKECLAKEAIYLEQEIIKECVGCQDQIAATYGGLQQIIFHKTDNFTIVPITISKERKKELQSHLMLFYTGCKRQTTASDVALSFVNTLNDKSHQLCRIRDMVNEATDILNSQRDINEFGKLLNEGWILKKQFSDKISNDRIDEIYKKALQLGVSGGKLIGAGQGGFILLFAEPELQKKIKNEFNDMLYVPFEFESGGSQIIYYDE